MDSQTLKTAKKEECFGGAIAVWEIGERSFHALVSKAHHTLLIARRTQDLQ